MKTPLITTALALACASSAVAQFTATFDNHARFQIEYPVEGYTPTTGTWGNIFTPGSDTFNADDGFIVWAQAAQYNMTDPATQTAFNNATSFTLSLANAPYGQEFDLFASTTPIGLDGTPLMSFPLNDGAATGFLAAERDVATFLGTFPSVAGTWGANAYEISGNAALDALLSDTVFGGSVQYIYVYAAPTTAGAWTAATMGGSITAAVVPEPATYALSLGILTIGLAVLRSRRVKSK
jgi:hypothetical protein